LLRLVPGDPGHRGRAQFLSSGHGGAIKGPFAFFTCIISVRVCYKYHTHHYFKDVKKKPTLLSELRGDPDNFARVCQLEAIIENLYPFLDRGGALTLIEREQRKRMVEHLETLMPWLIPGNR
jgi:hypothetical protein